MFLFHCKKKRKKPSSLLPPPPPSYHSANDDYVFKTTISTTTTTMKTTRKTFRFVVPFKHSHFILGCTIWTFSFSFSFFRHCVFHRISMDIFHSLCVYSFFFFWLNQKLPNQTTIINDITTTSLIQIKDSGIDDNKDIIFFFLMVHARGFFVFFYPDRRSAHVLFFPNKQTIKCVYNFELNWKNKTSRDFISFSLFVI